MQMKLKSPLNTNYEIIGRPSGNSCYSLLEHRIFNIHIAQFPIKNTSSWINKDCLHVVSNKYAVKWTEEMCPVPCSLMIWRKQMARKKMCQNKVVNHKQGQIAAYLKSRL